MINKKTFIFAPLLLVCLSGGFCQSSLAADTTDKKTIWKEDFSETTEKNKVQWPYKWIFKSKFGTANAQFFVIKDDKGTNNILCLKSEKSTGTILKDLSGLVSIKETPIVRWCWRAKKLPPNADGRFSDKDDQAVGLYIGTGKWKQDSVAYRWETETPMGTEGNVAYGAGMVSVKWFCLKNKDNEMDKWFIEERNFAEDFQKTYGYLPDQIAISFSCNSQYTGTNSEASVAWVEFIPSKKNDKKLSENF
jgi:hypothetical protein